MAGKQPAEHAERRGLAGPVGPEQAEDLAPADLEADVVDGRETCRTAAPGREPRRPPRRIGATGRPVERVMAGRRRSARAAVPPRKSTMKPSSNRGGVGTTVDAARARRSARRGAASADARTSRTRPPSGTASMTSGRRADAPGARGPFVPPAARPGTSGRPPGRSPRRAALRQHLAFVQHDDVLAALGLVEVRRAEQHRQALARAPAAG